MAKVIDRRTLNRTLLLRQLLLERARMPALEAIEHLVGIQAQEPPVPYITLWTRLHGLAPAQLVTLIEGRQAARVNALYRMTIHLVSADDALAIRPLLQPLAERVLGNTYFGGNLRGLDTAEVVAVAKTLLREHPMTTAELARALTERWPNRDAHSLAMAPRFLLPTVQPPPRGLWGQTGPPRMAPLDDWLGRPMASEPSVDRLVRRYLSAFGPASVADVANWSGLTGLRAVFERLRPELRVARDESGRELFDVPEGSMAAADEPAPVRYFGQYDNVFLGHADRSRIIPDGLGQWTAPPGRGGLTGSLTVDGFWAGTWRLVRSGDLATLGVALGGAASSADRAEVEAEGRALARFVVGDRADPSVEVS